MVDALNTRYTDPSCSTFNNELGNIWKHFYKVKKDNLDPVHIRATAAESKVINLSGRVQNELIPTFQNALD